MKTASRGKRGIVISAVTVAATFTASAVVGAAQGQTAGLGNGSDRMSPAPTTTAEPYVIPVAPRVNIVSHLTVDDLPAGNGYRMVGIPDGLGAFQKRDNVVAFMNHELTDDAGIVRRHGEQGAFISRLVINPDSGAVVRGRDLVSSVRYYHYRTNSYSDTPGAPEDATYGHTAAFSRFCSASLTTFRQLFSGASGNGFRGRLFFGNEEFGDEGRLFATRRNGRSIQLPRLGLFSWENTLAAPNTTDTTMVVGNEDANPGQLRIYVGRKRPSGGAVHKAGLTNGRLFVVDAVNEAVSTDAEFRTAYQTGEPAPVVFGAGEEIDWRQSGVEQNVEAAAKGLSLNRIEDGAFDPRRKNDYYFTTTEGGGTNPNPSEPGNSRDGGGLWRLRFADIESPERGGTLTLVLDGTEAPYLSKPDNMEIDDEGNLLIQEDPGGNDHLARIVAYNLDTGARGVVARFDPGLFGVSNPSGATPDDRAVLTTDEESSGIISTDHQFGDDTFLFNAQVHTEKGLPPGNGSGTVEEYVERGQLLSMEVDDWSAVYTID